MIILKGEFKCWMHSSFKIQNSTFKIIFKMSILIKNGRIITATDDYVADIFIEGETHNCHR